MTELTRPGTGFREKLVGVGAIVVGKVISGLYSTLGMLRKAMSLEASFLCLHILQPLTDKMGFVSGQEFLVAFEEAKNVGANILLGDRDVQVTLRRLSEALSKSELVKIREIESPTRSPAARELKARGIVVGNNPDDIREAVEALKERQSVRVMMATLKQELPEVYTAMIQER